MVLNNEFVCYFVNKEGSLELENKNNVKYNYTYKINIDFAINKIKKDIETIKECWIEHI